MLYTVFISCIMHSYYLLIYIPLFVHTVLFYIDSEQESHVAMWPHLLLKCRGVEEFLTWTCRAKDLIKFEDFSTCHRKANCVFFFQVKTVCIDSLATMLARNKDWLIKVSWRHSALCILYSRSHQNQKSLLELKLLVD